MKKSSVKREAAVRTEYGSPLQVPLRHGIIEKINRSGEKNFETQRCRKSIKMWKEKTPRHVYWNLFCGLLYKIT